MSISRKISCAAAVTAALSCTYLAHGQEFPTKPVHIYTADAGGGADFAARVVAQGISGPLGQPVIVDNRGIVSIELVAKAVPDGYSLVLFASPLWIGPLLQKTNYDPVRDFSPVTTVSTTPLIIVVHPAVAANSVKELIALAKGKPGDLNYASAATGGATHLAAELLKSMAGINVVRVNYKGAAPALNGVMGAEVHMMVPNAASALPQVKAGRLRALAVTTAQPSALTPGLPTVAASGLPGYEAVEIFGILAPAGTPVAAVNKLNQEMVRALATTDVKEKFLNSGAEVAASSPAQFAAKIKFEIAKWDKVIKEAGIRAE